MLKMTMIKKEIKFGKNKTEKWNDYEHTHLTIHGWALASRNWHTLVAHMYVNYIYSVSLCFLVLCSFSSVDYVCIIYIHFSLVTCVLECFLTDEEKKKLDSNSWGLLFVKRFCPKVCEAKGQHEIRALTVTCV